MELILGLGAAAGAWLWYDSLRAREQALAVCRRACRGIDAQLLDETVALDRLRLGRNQAGRVTLDRRYRFEFSTAGDDRRTGRLRLIGQRVADLQMDHPDGLTLVTPPDT